MPSRTSPELPKLAPSSTYTGARRGERHRSPVLPAGRPLLRRPSYSTPATKPRRNWREAIMPSVLIASSRWGSPLRPSWPRRLAARRRGPVPPGACCRTATPEPTGRSAESMEFDERYCVAMGTCGLCVSRVMRRFAHASRDDIADAVEAVRSMLLRDHGDRSCMTRSAQRGDRRRALAGSGQTGAGSCATRGSDSVSSFSVVIAPRRIREICICETPSCSAISRCVRSSKKRS
jgi:hypothetical protein